MTAHRIPSEAARSAVERFEAVEAGVEAGRAEFVSKLRTDGYTWEEIGDFFGVTRQAAHTRWNTKVERDSNEA